MGAPLNQGLIGKQTGSNLVQTGGEFGERLVSELQARYYEQAYRGNVFIGATQVVITFTAGLTTASGLVFGIQNAPSASVAAPKNLVLLNASFTLLSTTSCAVGLSIGPTTTTFNTATTTGPTITSALGAVASGSVARVVSVVASPVVQCILGGMSGASAITEATSFVDLGGSIIITPGSTATIVTSAAQTGWAALTWMEVPI